MNFELSEEQRAIRDVARDFAAKEMAPYAAQWDEDCTFPLDTLRKAAGLGLATIFVAEDVGGTGLGRMEGALIFEALAEGCASTAAFLSIHNMAGSMIDTYGDQAQRKRWLPAMATMELIASYCLTESSSGSDAADLTTRAKKDNGNYLMNGSKAFVSGGGESDIYLVMCRTGGDGPKGISCMIVEKGMKGLSFGARERKMGWNSQPTTAVNFDDCRVPVENRLGDEGIGFKIAMQGLDGGRLNIGACSLGGAQFAFDTALAYVKERKQFGKRIADFQATRFKLADMATELEAARLLLYAAAVKVEEGAHDATMAAAMAKRFATDIGFRVTNEALQLHGGYGYLKDYPIERILRDLRVHQILEGTNEIMRVVISKHLLKD